MPHRSKLVSLLVTIVLVAGLAPTSAFAQSLQAGAQPDLASQAAVSTQAKAATITAAQKKSLKKALLTGMQNVSKSIDISKLKIPYSKKNASAIHDIMSDIVNQNPDLFYTRGAFSFNYGGSVGATMYFMKITPTYDYAKSAIPKMRAKYETALNDLLSWVPADASEVERAKAAHDWIVRHCNYNNAAAAAPSPDAYGSMSPWNAYGALVEHAPVCEGYSLAFIAAMNRLDIDCTFVSQTLGADGHAWNRARIGGSWFNIDVTWDDNYTDPDSAATPDTTYFLKSDVWFKAHPGSSGFHTKWAPAGVAGTDTRYDQYEQQDWPVYSAPAAIVVSGATYKLTSSSAKNLTVTMKKAPANKKSVTVPATVTINNKQYAVTGIAGSAFAKSTATTVTVKTKSLTKAAVTNCFKNSKVATVKVPQAKLSAYKTIFAKSNSGKKVAIK